MIQNSYFAPNVFLKLHKWKANWKQMDLKQGIMRAINMVLTSKELFLKLATLKT